MNILQLLKRSAVSLLLIFLVCLTVGCTKESLTKCDLYLGFRYDYNMSKEDLFAAQVELVQVFVFDKSGKYVETWSQGGDVLKRAGYLMKVPSEMRGHTVVVWAGLTDNFYQLPTMSVGDPIEKLTLKHTTKDISEIDNLWHGTPQELVFNDYISTVQIVNLIRNTNDFTVGVTNSDGVSIAGSYTVRITSANGGYDHTNNYLANNPLLTYMPYAMQPKLKLRTLRLLSGDKAELTVLGNDGVPLTIGGSASLNLVEFLLKSTPIGMSPQEYLDRCYQWDISLAVDPGSSVALYISINNWVHWFHSSDQ